MGCRKCEDTHRSNSARALHSSPASSRRLCQISVNDANPIVVLESSRFSLTIRIIESCIGACDAVRRASNHTAHMVAWERLLSFCSDDRSDEIYSSEIDGLDDEMRASVSCGGRGVFELD